MRFRDCQCVREASLAGRRSSLHHVARGGLQHGKACTAASKQCLWGGLKVVHLILKDHIATSAALALGMACRRVAVASTMPSLGH